MVSTLPLNGRVRGSLFGAPVVTPVKCRRVSRTAPRASPIVCSSAAAALQLPYPDLFSSPATSYASPASTSSSRPVGADTGFRSGFSACYSKGQQLGSGSFGTVFRGISIQTGQEVAIKVMPKVRGKLNKEATMDKITREIEYLERVQGRRGIVQVLDRFEEANEVLVVTEMCTGGDLQRLSDAYPVINERCLALIAKEVLLVIKTCNDHGLTHGDIKPANFVLKHPLNNPLFSMDPAFAAASWLKVVDFGCSQVAPTFGELTLAKRAGTPVFMAPELFERSYGREADVWSAGIMLYQIFCKRFPFWDTYEAAKSSRIDDIAVAVCQADMRFDFGPWLNMSPEGMSFIKGLLTRDPADRMTVQEALAHPWLVQAMIPRVAPPPQQPAAVRFAGNNIVRRPPAVTVHRSQAVVV